VIIKSESYPAEVDSSLETFPNYVDDFSNLDNLVMGPFPKYTDKALIYILNPWFLYIHVYAIFV